MISYSNNLYKLEKSRSIPTVSVLIPVYNGAQYIQDAIDSVLGQRAVDVEVIVIDDGSTDDTPDILREYGSRIKLLRQENTGHVKARNNGAKMARGEWLAFLDADDRWLPDKLRKQFDITTADIGLVYTDHENFGNTSRVKKTASESRTLWEGDIFDKLLLGNFITVSSVIMRQSWFEKLGGFDASLRVCEDWDMWLRFSESGGIAAVCREPLTLYHFSPSSMSFNHDLMLEGRLLVLHKALTSPRGKKASSRLRKKAMANVWKWSAWHAMPYRRWSALIWYLKAACYSPFEFHIYKQIIKCCLGVRKLYLL